MEEKKEEGRMYKQTQKKYQKLCEAKKRRKKKTWKKEIKGVRTKKQV